MEQMEHDISQMVGFDFLRNTNGTVWNKWNKLEQNLTLLEQHINE